MSSLRPSRKLVDVRLVLVVAAVSLAIGISVAVTVSQSYGQVSGAPGSPGATTTIGGEQLPPPPQNSAARSSATPRSRNLTGRRASCRRRARRTSS